jgi:uncharacterized delta-60 repeat protein
MRRVKFTPRLELLEDRTLLDGTLDATFGVGGLVNTGLTYSDNNFVSPAALFATAATHQNSLAVQPDGRIVVAGVSAGATTAFSVGRFNANGTLDTTFGVNGLATINFSGSTGDQANAVAIQADGKIVVAGSATLAGLQQFGLVRFNANGSLDTTFGKGGFVTIPTPSLAAAADSIVVQTNGRIVVAGTAGGNFAIARVHSDGLQDSDFNGNGIDVFNIGLTLAPAFVPPTGTVDTLTSMSLQPNGQIVIAGYTNLNATKDGINPAPINALGVPYTTGIITGATNTGPITVTAPNHGLISGTRVDITGVQGDTAADGSWTITVVDSNHFFLNGSNGTSSGTYTSGGTWTVVPPKAWNFAVARLNAQNGLLDSSFAGTGIAILDFFHALAGGKSIGLGDDMAEDVVVQPDGKIVVAGRTWMDDNLQIKPNFGLARFNADGSLDQSFNLDGIVYTDFSPDFSDAQDLAYSVALQGDGKIVVAGTSNRATNGAAQNDGFALVRYNLDGTEDQTFGLHGEVYTNFPGSTGDLATNIFMESDGQIVVAGTTNQGGSPVFALARYSGLQSGSFQFSQPTYSVQENGGSVLITVTRGGGTQNTVTVTYATSDGTAMAGTNYTATTGALTFAPGQTTATFSVPITDDGVYQPANFVFNLTLSNPTGGGFLGFQKTATVTIIETDQPGSLEFSAPAYSVNQNGGSITITVTRSNGNAGPVAVSYMTSNGTAVAGTDYTATTGQVSFAAGETSKTFTIPILNSGLPTSNLAFNVSLLTPTGGSTLGSPNMAVVNIVNTNQPGVVQFATASYSVAENAGNVTLTVTESSGSTVPVAVTYATSDGTAVAGTNYAASTGTLTFAPGQTSASITIPVLDDGVFSVPNKSFNVTLSNPTNGATLGTTVSAAVTLIEKDGTPTQLFIAQAYLDILNRPVDPSGLATWTSFLNAGGSRSAVATGIMNSQEYRTIVVNNLFMKYLRRGADMGGLATYTAFLASGGTDEQVAAALLGSQEYLLNRGNGNNTGFLSALYQDVLNRPIDASGLATFGQFLASGGTRTQVAAILLSSTEYLTGVVQGFYQRFLRRPADPTGLNAFVTELQSVPVAVQPLIGSDSSTTGQLVRDETVIAALVGSQEYFNLVA